MNRAPFDERLLQPSLFAHVVYSVAVRSSDGVVANAFWAFAPNTTNTRAGGDVGLSSSGFDQHNTNYILLNSGCKNQYLYSYSSASNDNDAGYDVNRALGAWTVTQACENAEGGALKFFMAVRRVESRCPSSSVTAATHVLDPDGAGGVLSSLFYCDANGWLLFFAYNHSAGSNNALVSGVVPTSPESGYSHVDLATVGLTPSGDDQLRFYCQSSAHTRVVHFVTSTAKEKHAIAFSGSQYLNSVSQCTF